MPVSTRRRNARGNGVLLRDEILTAATDLLDAVDSESDLTLRGIACAAGITAPAIYAHFPDRDAIVAALAERAWHDVVDEIHAAAAAGLILGIGCTAAAPPTWRSPSATPSGTP